MDSLRSRIVYRSPSIPLRLGTHLACVFLLAVLSMPGRAQAQQWRTVSDKNGIRVERRSIPGERYDELRLSTLLNVSPEAIANYLFGKFLVKSNKYVTRTFIQRGPEMTVWSDVLSTPVTRDRCYSMRFERRTPPMARYG